MSWGEREHHIQSDVGDFKINPRWDDFGNWKLCNGRALTQTEIDAIIRSGIQSMWFFNYGWNLPDPRGRAIAIGGDGAGLTSRDPGTVTGTETHTITNSESAKHSHYVRVQHGANAGDVGGWSESTGNDFLFAATDRCSEYGFHPRKSGEHSSQPGMSTEGTNQPHNNMQPTIFLGNLFVYIG